MKTRLAVFGLALLACYICAVILIAQFNIARITNFGIEVGLVDRITTACRDMLNMYLYLPLIAIALSIAFLFAHYVVNKFVMPNVVSYLAVGFIGLITIHIAMEFTLGLAVLAPTRTLAGLASQGIAGSLGGWVYYQLHVSKQADLT